MVLELQRMLSRLPNSNLADLQKGDAVMILDDRGRKIGRGDGDQTAGGSGPHPDGGAKSSASSLLSPWSLGASGGEGEAAQ